MGFNPRSPISGGLDPGADPTLPIPDGSQPLHFPTAVGPGMAKEQDWIRWLYERTPRVWGRFACNGLGAVSTVSHRGVNTGAVTVTSTYIQIGFSDAFANTDYSPVVSSLDGDTFRFYAVNASNLNASYLRVYVSDAAGAPIDPTANVCRFALQVHGDLA